MVVGMFECLILASNYDAKYWNSTLVVIPYRTSRNNHYQRGGTDEQAQKEWGS